MVPRPGDKAGDLHCEAKFKVRTASCRHCPAPQAPAFLPILPPTSVASCVDDPNCGRPTRPAAAQAMALGWQEANKSPRVKALGHRLTSAVAAQEAQK
jgi:hypothetical protein